MQDKATTSHQPCLERMADGWRWRAIPSTGITVIQATVTAFLGLMGALLFVVGMRIAVEPDQVGQSMLLLLAASVLVVIVVVLRSMIVQLVSWREAVFIVEGAPPQVLLLRGGCRKVIALADVAEVRVVYAGPADRQPTDTYLEIRRAGPRLEHLTKRLNRQLGIPKTARIGFKIPTGTKGPVMNGEALFRRFA